ncbi:ATP-binding protein [Sphingomonas sp. GC_Shp_1]|uniref:sensor histidine kinase n=1 Tax=unclassified Sphingomonas TaxID=196159 RepID=UPI00226AD2E8
MASLGSLRAITLLFILAFTAATIGTGIITYNATSRTIRQLVDARIAAAADAIAGEGATLATPELLRRMTVLEDDRDTGDLGITLGDPQRRHLGGNITLVRRLPSGFSTVTLSDHIKGLAHGRAYVRSLGGGRTLTVVAETEPIEGYAAARVRIYAAGFGAILLIVFAGTILFARVVAGRIAATRATAEAIIAGDMARRVPIRGDRGVFDAQAATFNLMLDRIDDLMRTMTHVSSDIAHDLRTPLARLHSQLGTLARAAETPALRAGIEQALAQSDELLAMFAAVLRIAEVEGGARRAGFATIDIAALAHEIAAMMAPVGDETGHVVVCAPAPPLAIRGDRQLLTQLLINLIENGLRHTPPGSRITLLVERRPGHAVIVVSDDGPGIPGAERARALRRFGRLDLSRGARDEAGGTGHGLGLALVEAIARLHDGTVRLEDAGPGLRVEVDLPVRLPA